MKIRITLGNRSKEVNFTEPQARIMTRLLNGETTIWINTHRFSGGELVWYREDGDYSQAECVGIRAFNGMVRAIGKAFGLDRDATNELHFVYTIY